MPPPTIRLWRRNPPLSPVTILVNPKSGLPVTKSRASARNPSTGKPVLKSSPPPYSIAPLLLVGPPSVVKRAQPPPTLTHGAIGEAGINLRRNAGVTKRADVSSVIVVLPMGGVIAI